MGFYRCFEVLCKLMFHLQVVIEDHAVINDILIVWFNRGLFRRGRWGRRWGLFLSSLRCYCFHKMFLDGHYIVLFVRRIEPWLGRHRRGLGRRQSERTVVTLHGVSVTVTRDRRGAGMIRRAREQELAAGRPTGSGRINTESLLILLTVNGSRWHCCIRGTFPNKTCLTVKRSSKWFFIFAVRVASFPGNADDAQHSGFGLSGRKIGWTDRRFSAGLSLKGKPAVSGVAIIRQNFALFNLSGEKMFTLSIRRN